MSDDAREPGTDLTRDELLLAECNEHLAGIRDLTEAGKRVLLDIGQHFLALQTGSYRARGHSTFKAFLQHECPDYEQSRVYQLIDFAEITEQLRFQNVETLPNDGQSQALVPVLLRETNPRHGGRPANRPAASPEALARAWNGAVTDERRTTARLVVEYVDKEELAAATKPREPNDPGTPLAPYVKRGELYAIGPHRILCDDSGIAKNVGRALDGLVPDLVFTDPPYGVGYTGKTPAAMTIEGDARDDAAGGEALQLLVADLIQPGVVDLSDTTEEFRRQVSGDTHRLAVATFEAIREHMPPGTPWYVCAPAGDMEPVLRHACLTLGPLRQSLLWIKPSPVMGRQDYHWMHEMVFYGWTPGGPHPWVTGWAGHVTALGVKILRGEGGEPLKNAAGTAVLAELDIARPSVSNDHPTSKPVALSMAVIRNHLQKGMVVLDPFAGAGNALVAAQQLGLIGVGIENEPKYVQRAIAKLENELQTKAELQD